MLKVRRKKKKLPRQKARKIFGERIQRKTGEWGERLQRRRGGFREEDFLLHEDEERLARSEELRLPAPGRVYFPAV